MKPRFPSSAAFWILASAYRDAGDSVLRMIRSEGYVGFAVMPCVFLYFRSIELALKAVLVHHKLSEREVVSRIGHHIRTLLSRAAIFTPLPALGIGPDDRQLLERFSDEYANKWFEYSSSWWRLPRLEDLQTLTRRVCSTVRKYVRARA
jgi:hypothetical protein